LRVVATLPLRSLYDGKRRLVAALTPDARSLLVRHLCSTVVQALRESGVVALAGLVSGDEAALEFSKSLGLVPIREESAGLNEALQTASEWAAREKADAHLIVLPDLPFVSGGDIRTIVEAAPAVRGIVICSDRGGRGTNVLLLRPCGVIPPAFGEGSYSRHLHAAAAAGVPAVTLDLSGTRWDVDTPADYAELSLAI
jgi:2-phospho-L-lactate guanylyltransferase